MTPINNFEVWQDLSSEVNVQQGGQIRPVQDFNRWYNEVCMELFRERVAAADLNQQLDDDLNPFLTTVNCIVVPQPGQPYDLVMVPADYEGFANMRILRQKDEDKCFFKEKDDEGNALPLIDGDGKSRQYDDPDFAQMRANFAGANLVETTVNKIDTQKWGNCLTHDTKSPTYSNPKITQFKGGFKIAPKGMQVVILDYYHTPRLSVFAYTIGAGDIVVYDAVNSTQLEWTSTKKNEFVTRLKKKYGGATRDGDMYAMAENDRKNIT